MKPGTAAWLDLTVEDAPALRDFYAAVLGWRHESVAVDDYEDFNMIPLEGEQPAAGICHARGVNAGIPPVWMVYFVVTDLDESLRRCEDRGGKILIAPRPAGTGRIAVIEDPARACCALYELESKAE